jgi:hypothetical protein
VLWLLKKDQVALDEVDRRVGDGREASFLLFLRRAQIHARRGLWPAARDDIDEYFRRRPPYFDATIYDGFLIRGFIREALGDHKGASESWRQGYRTASGTGDMSFLPVAIQSSLSGELTADDGRIMFNTVVGRMPINIPAMRIVENLRFDFEDIIKGLRCAWSSERGHDYARKIALLDISFAEAIQIQMPLTVAGICRHGAFGGTLTREDDELIWTMLQSLYRDYVDRKLNEINMIQLMGTWLGNLNRFTWPLAARQIQPAVRGTAGYVLGSRYKQLGRPADARSFFEAALKDSSPGSAIHLRVKTALDQLSASK